MSARITDPADDSILVPPPTWASRERKRTPSPLTLLRDDDDDEDYFAVQAKPFPSPLTPSPSKAIPEPYTLEDDVELYGHMAATPSAPHQGNSRLPFCDSWNLSPRPGLESHLLSGGLRTSSPRTTFENIVAEEERIARGVRSPAIPITPYQQMGPKAWELEELEKAPARNVSARKLFFGRRNGKEKEKEKEERRREQLKKKIKLVESSAKTSIGIGVLEQPLEGKSEASKGEQWI